MTLQQEAYKRIDQMTDDGVRVLIDMIDKMRTVSVIGFKDNEINNSAIAQNGSGMSKAEKKKRFMQSAGKIQVDANAVSNLRERSMI